MNKPKSYNELKSRILKLTPEQRSILQKSMAKVYTTDKPRDKDFFQNYCINSEFIMQKLNNKIFNSNWGLPEIFYNWANSYFSQDSGNCNKLLVKVGVFHEFRTQTNTANWTMVKFTKALELYCEIANHISILNPDELQNTQGRIVRNIYGRLMEMIYIRSENQNISFPELEEIEILFNKASLLAKEKGYSIFVACADHDRNKVLSGALGKDRDSIVKMLVAASVEDPDIAKLIRSAFCNTLAKQADKLILGTNP